MSQPKRQKRMKSPDVDAEEEDEQQYGTGEELEVKLVDLGSRVVTIADRTRQLS